MRVSTHLTGRPRRRASQAATTNSGYADPLAPNPPPTAGAITRTRSGGSSSAAATTSRVSWGRWVVHHSVTPSPPLPTPGTASTADGSMGAADMRWLTTRPETTRSWPVKESASALSFSSEAWFDPCDSNTIGESGASAANGSVTAGSGS